METSFFEENPWAANSLLFAKDSLGYISITDISQPPEGLTPVTPYALALRSTPTPYTLNADGLSSDAVLQTLNPKP